MSIISNRRPLLTTTLKIATFIVAIYYVVGLLPQQQELDNQLPDLPGVETVKDKFVCLVNYTCVYSAYYDDITENKPLIRIVGVDNPKTNRTSLQCFYFEGQRNLMGLPYPGRKVTSNYYYNNLSKHSLTFFTCDIKNDGRPTYVWLGINGTHPSKEDLQTQMLPIHYASRFEKYRYKVAACVQPFHSGFDDALQVLEWIEYMRLIGVEHFTFYNYTAGPRVSDLLKSYGQDVVTVMNWNLPVEQGIHVYGQFVAASECAHRHRGVAKYVMAFDTDEFPILPPGYQNVSKYLDNLWGHYEELRNTKVNSVKFNSKFSFLNWPANMSLLELKQEHSNLRGVLMGLNIPTRLNFLPGGQTKFVYKPELVEESGVHWVDKEVDGSTWIRPPPQEAYYFHFHGCSNYFSVQNQVLLNNATCKQTQGIEADVYPALTFGSQLMDAVAKKILQSEEFRRVFNISAGG